MRVARRPPDTVELSPRARRLYKHMLRQAKPAGRRWTPPEWLVYLCWLAWMVCLVSFGYFFAHGRRLHMLAVAAVAVAAAWIISRGVAKR